MAAAEKSLDAAAERLLVTFNEEKKALHAFRNGFEKMMLELGSQNPKHSNMFILVDELDRCRPDYAVQMLERIKHLFSVSGAVFVVATDTSQLEHAVCAIYGQGFDSESYLRRFFDRQYRFRPQSRLNFTKNRLISIPQQEKLNLPEKQDLAEFIDRCASSFGLSLRDTEQVIDMLSDALLTWQSNSKIQVAYFVPLLVIRKTLSEAFADIKAGSLEKQTPVLLSHYLSFSLKTLEPNGGNATAWQLFLAYYQRRHWNYDTVLQALHSSIPSNSVDSFAIEAIYNELHARIKEGGDRTAHTAILHYPAFIESIAAFAV